MAGIKIDIGANVGGAVTGIDKVSQALSKMPKASNQATQSLVNLSRVAQDAPYGFIGIANNINPLLESFQRLKESTGSTGGALSALKGQLIGPAGVGLAVGIVSSLIVSFGSKLFGASVNFSAVEIAAGRFDNKLKDLKQSLDDLKDSLEFSGKIQKLVNELNGLTGGKLSIANRGVDTKTNLTLMGQLSKDIKELTDQNDKLVKTRVEYEKFSSSITGKSTALGKAVLQFGSLDLPQSMVDKLGKVDKELVRQFQKRKETIKELQGQFAQALQGVVLSPFEDLVDVTRENKKKVKDKIDRFVADLHIDPVKLSVEPIIDPDAIRKAILTLGPKLSGSEQVDKFFSSQIEKLVSSRPSAAKDNSAAIKEMGRQFLELGQIGAFVGNKLADVFDSVFDAITNGQNAFRALGQAIKQLVTDLIKSFARMFIIKGLLRLIDPTGTLGSLFGGTGFRAGGGAVAAGRPYVVGESGRELFIPSNSGRIVPNGSLSQYAGQAAQMVSVTVNGIISGNNLALVMARNTAYQNRNV